MLQVEESSKTEQECNWHSDFKENKLRLDHNLDQPLRQLTDGGQHYDELGYEQH